MGFWVIEALSAKYKIPLTQKGFASRFGGGHLKHAAVILAQPLTYMNLSGKAVRALFEGFNATTADLIIIHDDIDLVLGKLKVKLKGGDAGHKGIRSIIQELGTGEFSRIRIGIGRPPCGQDTVDYVLQSFKEEEMTIIEEAVEKAIDLIEQSVLNEK